MDEKFVKKYITTISPKLWWPAMLVVYVVFQMIFVEALDITFFQKEGLAEKRGEDTDHDGWEVCTHSRVAKVGK